MPIVIHRALVSFKYGIKSEINQAKTRRPIAIRFDDIILFVAKVKNLVASDHCNWP